MHRNLSLCISACLRKVHAKDVCIWMCRCAYVYRDRGTLGLNRSSSKCTHCPCKGSHLFSWFCFPPACGLQTLLKNKGSLKNAALPVFPNVQNAALNLNGASSDAQPCRCCRKPPACRATTTRLHNMRGRRVGRKGEPPSSLHPNS